jgi:putative peptidoglycan lipid II flippase
MTFSVQNWLSASIILVSVAVVSKGLGFLREILVAYYFGASAQVDAFMVALSLPMLLAGGIGIAFSTGLVPVYHKALQATGVQGGNAVVGSAVLSATAFSVLLLVPLIVMPLPFIHLVTPSLPQATAQLAAGLTRWLAIYLVGLNLVYILTAVYHAIHHFKIPAVADLAFNTVTILVLVGYGVTLGIQALILGNVLGIALCVVLLLAFLAKSNQVTLTLPLNVKESKALLLLVWPIVTIEVLTQLGGIAENYYASRLDEGSIAALSYAKRITSTIVALLALNLARGIFPTLSVMASEGKNQEAMALLTKVNKQLIIVVLPIAVCLMCYRHEILSLLYLRGAFDAAGLNITSEALIFYAAGLLVAVMEPLLITTSYAFSNTVTPLVTSLASLAVMIVLLELLTPMLGIGGIALSLSLACLVRVVALMLWVEKRMKGLDLGELVKIGATSLACALLAFGPIAFLAQTMQGVPLTLFILVILSFVLYLSIAHVVMNDEITAIRRRLSQRLGY